MFFGGRIKSKILKMVANKVNIHKNDSCTKQKILITKTAAFVNLLPNMA